MSKSKPFILENEIAPYYYDWFMDFQTPNQILTGGRACTKSSMNALKIAYKFATDDNCSIVVIRNTLNTHQTSTWAELKSALDKMGVYYKATKNPLRIYSKRNTIYFFGLDNVEKLKGLKDGKSDIKVLWFFEITEFNSPLEMSQAKSSAMRGDKEEFISIYEYNPHYAKSHWTYDWADGMRKQRFIIDDNGKKESFCRFQHNTLLDLPDDIRKKWLGKPFLQEVEMMKLRDIEEYNHIYLGLPARLVGQIYKKFNYDKVVTDTLSTSYQFINIGIDTGYMDATVFTATGFRTNCKSIEVFKTQYHKNGKSPQKKDINDYVEDALQFIIEVRKTYKAVPIRIFNDSADKSFGDLLRKKLQDKMLPLVALTPVNKKKKEKKGTYTAIQERIHLTNLMLGFDGYLKIHKDCKELISALETATYNDMGERIDNGTYDIDSLDSFEYSFLADYIQIKNVLIGKGSASIWTIKN
jgi:PBSX family phage terminase large subunit